MKVSFQIQKGGGVWGSRSLPSSEAKEIEIYKSRD